MYVMSAWLFPAKARVSAFHNNSGPRMLQDVNIAGFSYTPGKQLELIIGVGTNRYYDVPLSFMGERGGAQYALPNTYEEPVYTSEVRPRDVTADLVPHYRKAKGICYGSLTWEKANVTLLVVVLEKGEIIFWPPHKIYWSHDPQPFPHWLKRRYADDTPPLELTRVREATDEEILLRLDIAKEALSLDASDWRSHGIGLIQCYKPGPSGPKHFRVHVWTPSAVQIGLESGIHNHRYGLESWVVAGTLCQEEWTLKSNPEGMWRLWEHHNDSMEPTPTSNYFDATPRTLDIHSGQAYTFPSNGFHRSIPRSDVVITVIERNLVEGFSYAIAPKGHTPINGQTVELPVKEYMALARKHIGM